MTIQLRSKDMLRAAEYAPVPQARRREPSHAAPAMRAFRAGTPVGGWSTANQRSVGPASDLADTPCTAYVLDQDEAVRDRLEALLGSVRVEARCFSSAAEFLAALDTGRPAVVILDVRLEGSSGLKLQNHLRDLGASPPVIFMTAHADIQMAVEAMKAGASDFLAKPFRDQDMLDAVFAGLARDLHRLTRTNAMAELRGLHDTLSRREREVMKGVVSGLLNKQIAGDLGLSEVTVKLHRGSLMRKMKARSLPELVRKADALAEA